MFDQVIPARCDIAAFYNSAETRVRWRDQELQVRHLEGDGRYRLERPAGGLMALRGVRGSDMSWL